MSKKKKIGIAVWAVFVLLLYAAAAVGIIYIIHLGGDYPSGTDTMSHIYKGNVLYDALRKGNWYPLYDEFWYNGAQMMRYWAPLPVYVLALCQMIAKGNALYGYLVFVGLVFFLGAVVWLYIGVRKERPFVGAFLGILWFFMPNNLYALFVEGNLPRALSMVLLPLLFYFIYEYLFEKHWKALIGVIPVFALIVLCHVGYAGMIIASVALLLLVYCMIYPEKGKCLRVLCAMALPFLLTGIWMFASFKGETGAAVNSQAMEAFFQKAIVSLNPLRRISIGNVEFYFGLAAFLLAVFGGICSKRREMVGFWTAVLLFFGTTTVMYPILEKIPGGQYLWMLRFISIALCMILYSFLLWKSLRKWLCLICCVVLVLDVVPSLDLVYKGKGERTAKEQMEQQAKDMLIEEAKSLTTQRAAILDGGELTSMAQYLLTDYNGANIHSTFGAGGQYVPKTATANNIALLNESLAQGCYRYLFDRALELGNDTLLVKMSLMEYEEDDIDAVTRAAKLSGYQLVDANTGFMLYHLNTSYENFGTTCQYNGIGIGTSATLMSLSDPDIEEGESVNLSDYTYEELSQYKLIYLSGFTYDDKGKAEEMLIRLGKEGVRIVIAGDGIPNNEETKNQEFLGVTCHNIVFENGYPILYVGDEELDCELFGKEHSHWQTVYFTGLENEKGYLYDAERKMDFFGTSKNDNIYFIGLNLPYHYSLTHDETTGGLLRSMTDGCLRELPDRTVVPIEVKYEPDQITIKSDTDDVNTSLAYHDIFESDKKITSKRNLTYVSSGTTIIQMHYPYLWVGAGISLLGVVLTVLFLYWVRRTDSMQS